MKSLVVGVGIGMLYKAVLTEIGADVYTVDLDPNKMADFTDINDAIRKHGFFDTVHICTPNFTHLKIARQIASVAGIVFIEKPGVKFAEYWAQLVKDYPKTRFMMVKNNMWRDNIPYLTDLAAKAETIRFNWINKDRVPNPGTWFTTLELAFGGVSRDLLPHLLSLYIAINPDWRNTKRTNSSIGRYWELKDLVTTDYGIVKADGVYDVDDTAGATFADKWYLSANWRDMVADRRNIEFVMADGTVTEFELGLCPEYAYRDMIKDAVANINNDNFWATQLEQDLWIHQQVEVL